MAGGSGTKRRLVAAAEEGRQAQQKGAARLRPCAAL